MPHEPGAVCFRNYSGNAPVSHPRNIRHQDDQGERISFPRPVGCGESSRGIPEYIPGSESRFETAGSSSHIQAQRRCPSVPRRAGKCRPCRRAMLCTAWSRDRDFRSPTVRNPRKDRPILLAFCSRLLSGRNTVCRP